MARRTMAAMATLIAFAWPTFAGAADSEIQQRLAIVREVQQALQSSDFAHLDALSSSYRIDEARTSSGVWKLAWFYKGIERMLPTGKHDEAAFVAIEDRLRRWSAQRPDSVAAPIALAVVLIDHGWSIRGNGYANTVEQGDMDAFLQKVWSARQLLETHRADASIDPRWYQAMIVVARVQSWGRPQFEALVSEALGRQPQYQGTYVEAQNYFLPQWSGDVAQVDKFARTSAERTAGVDGRSMYARLYWAAADDVFGNGLFKRSSVDWQEMKAGFEDLTARYPDALNFSAYARFACLAGDANAAAAAFARIGPLAEAEVWNGKTDALEACRDWANRKPVYRSTVSVGDSPTTDSAQGHQLMAGAFASVPMQGADGGARFQLLAGEPPAMPPEAIDQHVSGEVAVLVSFDAQGGVTDVLVERSPSDILSSACVAAVRKWRVAPMHIDGKPHAFRARQSFFFSSD